MRNRCVGEEVTGAAGSTGPGGEGGGMQGHVVCNTEGTT